MTETLKEQIAQRVHERYGSLLGDGFPYGSLLGDGFPYDSLSQEQKAEYLKCAEGLMSIVKTELEGSLLTDEERRELCKKCPEYYISDDPVSGTERCKFMGMLARTTICEKHLEAQLAKTIGRLGV